jgi:hypothetical protein
MSFNGTEGSLIPIATAAAMTAKSRKTNPTANKGVFFGKDIINALLAPSAAMGIRFYFAENTTGARTLVMVAADANQNDLTDNVADDGKLCPPFNSTPNVLNQ